MSSSRMVASFHNTFTLIFEAQNRYEIFWFIFVIKKHLFIVLIEININTGKHNVLKLIKQIAVIISLRILNAFVKTCSTKPKVRMIYLT